MGDGKSGQKGEGPSASQGFKPVDRDSRSQADYGGSIQHRDEDAGGAESKGSEGSRKRTDVGSPPMEPGDGPTTPHTGP